MKRYSTFLGRKNQYCENDYTTKCNLEIQWDPYQITNAIFHRTRTKNFTKRDTDIKNRLLDSVGECEGGMI